MEHLNMTTPDGAQLNLDALYKICPSCFTEAAGKDGKVKRVVDFKKLRALLGDDAEDDAPEAYDFTWVGKRAAQREAAAPIKKTLRPCPEESVDWENTQNLYIEGDNLEVLKLLQNSYMGKVKMIYIDPPYNTGNDFVYHDDFAQSAEEYDEHNINEDGQRYYTKNTDSNGRFHSDWCSMMYTRLVVARTLLTNDGVIFISIDDNEQRNMRNICDEIFGAVNFGGTIIWKKKTNGNNMGVIPPVHDYILVYTKNIDEVFDIGFKNTDISGYSNPDNDPRGLWKTMDLSANHKGPHFGITNPITGETYYPSEGRYWVFNEIEVQKRIKEGRIIFGKSGTSRPVQRVFLSERGLPKRKAESWWDNKGMNEDATAELKELFGIAKVFSHPKPVELLYNLCSIVLEKNDIILDFFSGSATSAHAILKLNHEDGGKRKFILVQLPENIDQNLKTADNTAKAYAENSINFLDKIGKTHTITEIGKERIRRAGKLIKENNPDLDTGFRVFKCDTSNMKDVYFAPKDYSQELLFDLEDNIKEDRTDLDLLFDCMLRWGVELSLPLSSEKVGNCTIHNVNDGDLVACFDGKITDEVIDAIAELSPLRVVFRDSSFTEASQKMNLFELFKQKCGWSDEEVKNNVKVI